MKTRFLFMTFLFLFVSCSKPGIFKEDPEAPMTYTESRAMGESAEALISYLKNHHPDIVKTLNPPAEQLALDRFERMVGRKLPQDFRGLYLLMNGQKKENLPALLNGYELLSLEDIEINWKKMKATYANRVDFLTAGKADGPVRSFWWYPMWIPFAKTVYGDYYCLDLFPTRKGKIGQIIEFRQDNVLRRHMGYSLNDFIGEYEKGLQTGKYYWDPEYKMFLKKN
ncbi:MAG TPA: SMI1/KNR4 family protein [Candidatus Omnitrophota bacterium]|nr:SMI1/KNR4 family protein [Candidatus Omnitrophota bacterium]HPB67589.1 SMI1/KNR4 family protein [Candidatus Omnitrophota bacterium]HQO57701.1 SMI1/KNR4 family protein [Candidatus Omnitrophota bacterium]HQP11148.1 SMI1/KNR4 family protein [Candidatus Omnitrophota bacterium]